MLASVAFTLAALAYGVSAAPGPLEPSGSSVFREGGDCTILWDADTTGTWTTMYIELMTGDNFNQVHLKTVATVDGTDATKNTFSYPCLDVTPNSKIYFYKFTSPGATEPLFTTRFTIADATGNTTAPTQTQTATNGDIIQWDTGALTDPTQGDAPPPTSGATGNSTSVAPSGSASATSRTGSGSTTRTSSGTGTGTSTATTTSRPNGASKAAVGSVAVGAFGAILATLFL